MEFIEKLLTNKLIFYCGYYVLVFVFSIVYTFTFLKEAYKRLTSKTKSNHDLSTKPSCLTDPKYGTHGTLSLKNYHDFDIHYVANGSKEKPLMLFLHGFPEFWYIWKYQLPEFGKDYYAVAIDMIGYGESSKPKELEFYKSKELSTCVKEVIKELGYNSCVLVGHDWGGGVAFMVANDYPEVVDKLITLNAPHPLALKKLWLSFSWQIIASGYMFFFQLPLLPEYVLSTGNYSALEYLMTKGPLACKNSKQISDEDMSAFKYNFKQGGFTCPLNYYRNIFTLKNFQQNFNQLRMPICYIWGEDDLILSTDLVEIGRKLHDNCTVYYIKGISHWVNTDEPQECNKCIRKFLQE